MRYFVVVGVLGSFRFAALLSLAAPAASFQPVDVPSELARITALIEDERYVEAVEASTRLESSAELGPSERAAVLQRRASAQIELGRTDEALLAAEEAERLAEGGDAALLAELAIVRGNVWRRRGFAYRAAGHFTRALGIAEEIDRNDLKRRALILLSSAHQELGDWSRVLDYSERAFEAEPSPSDAARFQYLVQRGIAYYEFHDRDRALESFERAHAIAIRRGSVQAESVALGELGLVAWEFDRDRERAIELYERALAAARSISVPSLEVTWLNNLGNVYRDTGELDEALRRYEQALEIGPRDNPTVVKNVGQVLSLLGRYGEAEPRLLEALEIAEDKSNPKIRWQARMELASLYSDTDPEKAASYFEEALEIVEDHHGSALLERFRVGMLGRALEQYDPYDRYIFFLLERRDVEGAFRVAERARARVFLETLSGARAELEGALPREYLDAESELLQRISSLQARLRETALTEDERRAILTAVGAAEEELDALRLRLATERPALAEARYPRLWSPAELRDPILEPGELLVLFFLGESAAASWVVDASGVEVHALPPRREIERAVRALLPTLESPQAAVDAKALAFLSETLVGPLAGRLDSARHLVVVPHAILHYVPFEVLLDTEGRHVVESHTVSYAPSASSFAHLRTTARRGLRPPRLLAVGNPQTTVPTPGTVREEALQWIGRLKPLPHSRAEMQAIASAFAPRSRILDGESATEERLRAAVRDGTDILHLATHALVDEERPERSGLALSPVTDGTDGILQPREIYQLDIGAELVTLSACRTALGREVTGEGIVGLSRAFFYAGVRSVAASLWNVDDRSTAELMTAFYDRLRAGEPVALALAEAKRSFLAADSPWRHPYYWAPFIVTGHASSPVADFGHSLPRRLLLPGAIVLLVALVVGIVRKRSYGSGPPKRNDLDGDRSISSPPAP